MKLRINKVSFREIAIIFSIIFLLSMSLQSVPIPVTATSSSFTEDFTTPTYRDSGASTAYWWDGESRNTVLSPTFAGSYATPG